MNLLLRECFNITTGTGMDIVSHCNLSRLNRVCVKGILSTANMGFIWNDTVDKVSSIN